MAVRIQRIIFPLLICAFLCGPALLYCAEAVGVDVPVDLTTEPATYLEGGAQGVELPDGVSLRSFAKGQLQKAAEAKVNNFVPARATAVVTNAALQRGAIAASNAFVGWDCYPTYFGSSRIYEPRANAVNYIPNQKDEWTQDAWRRFATGVKDAALRHPDKRFLIYVVEGYGEPAYDPAYELVTNPALPGDCVAIMEDVVEGMPNVTVLTRTYSDAESYYRDFFRTDHHWNITGAFAAYGQVAEALGLETVAMDGTWEIPDYTFTGATARWGIDLLSETVFDADQDFSRLTVELPDGSAVKGNDHAAFWDAAPLHRHYSFYDLYYNSFGDCTFTGGTGARRALLVSNSYRGAIQRPLAWSYASLAANSQLWPGAGVTTTLDEQIAAAEADDVLFIANPGNLIIDDAYWR